jgi:hypothetical protein
VLITALLGVFVAMHLLWLNKIVLLIKGFEIKRVLLSLVFLLLGDVVLLILALLTK